MERKNIDGEMLTLEETVIKYDGLIHKIAQGFKPRMSIAGLTYDDLYQMAACGLIMSYNRFDPEKFPYSKFLNYAAQTMDGHIKVYFRDKQSLVHFPKRIKEKYTQVLMKNLEEADVRTLIEEMNLTEKEAVGIKHYQQNNVTLSLNAQHGDDEDFTLLDTQFTYDDNTSFFVEAFIETLQEREQIIVRNRLQNKTQLEIAKIIGSSQMFVSRILRERITPKAEDFFRIKKEKYLEA